MYYPSISDWLTDWLSHPHRRPRYAAEDALDRGLYPAAWSIAYRLHPPTRGWGGSPLRAYCARRWVLAPQEGETGAGGRGWSRLCWDNRPSAHNVLGSLMLSLHGQPAPRSPAAPGRAVCGARVIIGTEAWYIWAYLHAFDSYTHQSEVDLASNHILTNHAANNII